MKRARYLVGLLDIRDRVVLVGVMLAACGISAGVAHVTAVHRERAERERQENVDAWRGYQVLRYATPTRGRR